MGGGAAGGGEAERAALRQGVEELKLSQEEVKKFNEAFQDPKFLELFSDYAREISDPKHKAENDAYLRQIESENRAGQVYGDGLELVVPEVGFVVATAVGPDGPEPGAEAPEAAAAPPRLGGGQQAAPLPPPARGTPVYINVCTSDKVAAATSSQARGPGGASGQGWSIPFTLGGQQSVLVPEKCRTIDFVCHPDTRKLTQRSKALLNLVAETALEDSAPGRLLFSRGNVSSPCPDRLLRAERPFREPRQSLPDDLDLETPSAWKIPLEIPSGPGNPCVSQASPPPSVFPQRRHHCRRVHRG